MRRLLLLLLLPMCIAAAPPAPEPYCKLLPFDEEVPAGLTGTYEIVGKESGPGQSYAGVLEISVLMNAYALTRTVEGQTITGEAWVEQCSADEFLRLRARYDLDAKTLELSCYLRYDGGNYTRASCTTFEGGGLEAWFQRHDRLAP